MTLECMWEEAAEMSSTACHTDHQRSDFLKLGREAAAPAASQVNLPQSRSTGTISYNLPPLSQRLF
jgi:hypothetical protein